MAQDETIETATKSAAKVAAVPSPSGLAGEAIGPLSLCRALPIQCHAPGIRRPSADSPSKPGASADAKDRSNIQVMMSSRRYITEVARIIPVWACCRANGLVRVRRASTTEVAVEE